MKPNTRMSWSFLSALVLAWQAGSALGQEAFVPHPNTQPTQADLLRHAASDEVKAWQKHRLETLVKNVAPVAHEFILEDLENIMIANATSAIDLPNFNFNYGGLDLNAATIGKGVPALWYEGVGALFAGVNDDFTDSRCTIALIDPSRVLTADHCIQNPHDEKFWAYFPYEGVREVLIDNAVPYCSSDDCDPELADLAVVPLDGAYDLIPRLGSGSAALTASGLMAQIIGFGTSEQELADYGIKRMGQIALSDCTVFPPGNETLCFGFDAVVSPGDISSGNANCNNDSGGPMVAPVGAGRIIGVASQSSTFDCGAAGEGRYVNATHEPYKSFVNTYSCAGACPPLGDYAKLVGVDIQLFSAGDPDVSTDIDIPEGTIELIVTLNHGRGWYPDPNRIVLKIPAELNAECRRFVEAEVCVASEPPAGTHTVTVSAVQGTTGYQLGAVAVK